MKVNRTGLFWGILLIGAGAIALGQQLGYIQQVSDPQFWIWVFAIISLAAVIEYALSGWQNWGWLFPAGVLGGVALPITLAVNGVESAALASPIFFGLLIPFAAAYLTDRTRNWWALIPGGVMLFLVLTTLLVDNVSGEWVGAMFLLLFALAFLAVYLTDRTRNVRQYAAAHGHGAEEALRLGLAEKAREFVDQGAELYTRHWEGGRPREPKLLAKSLRTKTPQRSVVRAASRLTACRQHPI